MELLFQLLATFACALFAGAALYINVVEHPARMSCGLEVALAEWKPSYERATMLQGGLAAVGSVSALIAGVLGSGLWWILGGLLFFLVIPFTFIFIMPTNKKLQALYQALYNEKKSLEARELLEKWNRLHAVRTFLSLVALSIFLLIKGSLLP